MALIKCTECGHNVSDKAKMCPNCGCPVEIRVYCEECGQDLSEGTKVCSNCGSPNASFKDNKFGILHIEWKGARMLFDTGVDVYVNGKKFSSYSFEKGFSADIQILSKEMEIEIKYGFRTAKHLFSFTPNKDYKCDLVYSRVSGAFGFQMEDEKGNITTDNLSCLGSALCVFVPIVGIIYAFYVKKDKPTTFQTALITSVCGLIFWLIILSKMNMLWR